MTTSGRQAQGWMVAALVFGVIGPVRAAETSPSYADGALGKLGRGVANVLTCPLELIRTPTLVAREHGTIAGLTIGLVKGLDKHSCAASLGWLRWSPARRGFPPKTSHPS